MKLRNIAVVASVVVAFAGVSTAAAYPAAAVATTVHVTAKDFKFVLSTKTVKPGTVTFVVKNGGSSSHNFAIAGHSTKTIDPGKSVRLTVKLKPGRYPYKCTVDSHAALGMKGVLRVRS
jgi:plastocyanin